MTDCATVARQLGEVMEDGYLPRSCCQSCHDDAEQGLPPAVIRRAARWFVGECLLSPICCAGRGRWFR